ncbi:skin secretory protein xP2-like [Oxyura jamaicensis]|uniref:skin secretory protein xP2-like n=1 Tax=Oxyura jamaicensis TaxID=8884 RepID=UPI0015A659CC|nr:skin secretory protein xP2-like [Oxyura jamaicensis]
MKVQVLTAAALLLVQLSSAPAQAEAWGGSLEWQPGAGGPPEAPRPGPGGDTLPGQGAESSHPLAGAWEAPAEAPQNPGAPSKAMGSGQQDPPSELRRRLPQPSRSRSLGLSHHLKGHGKFNADTHSCHGIQHRPCQKPSDCGGCLGLYTCKLPAGTCGLKAVSWQRGGFLRSIQSAGRHAGTLLLEPRGSK